MTDFHLAELYNVETRTLKQTVRRNIDRFPDDFMFILSNEEAKLLIHNGVSQFVIPSNYNVGSTNIFAFSEQGVAMLSSVLKSKTALGINIEIMRAFVAFRQFALGYAELKQQLDDFMMSTNTKLSDVYQALTALSEQRKTEDNSKKKIGFQRYIEEYKEELKSKDVNPR
ncbi:DNA-binding protein [Bacteroidia bacterium]|nr:DNA-binding protein [Bacteroidia bacterium]